MTQVERNIRMVLDDIAWELEIDDDPRVQEELSEQRANLERELLDLMYS